ncbi:AAA family ATPase [Photobacterium sagamiensis]|uniref:McrB family protein n=1 Tax=Photobacterium sagamiensis TaxID=2910241 RepID=UPI003D147C60
MSVYLLTWNPKHFSNGSDGSEEGSLNYEIGEEVSWSCHSKQLKLGDTVYLIRVGVEPRGIIAKGTVTKESYLDCDWKDPNKQRSYIQFEWQEFRPTCERGLLPMLLLNSACQNQKWSSQTSGIQIQEQYSDRVNELWQAGKKLHSLEQFLCWDKEENFNPDGWYRSYVEACERAKIIRQTGVIEDDDVPLLWLRKSNGIASVGQGFMYKSEFETNSEFLKQLSLEIIQNPTKAVYHSVVERWKIDGEFKRNLWAVINRLFAVANPEKFTSIIGQSYLNDVFIGLHKQFQLPISTSNNWIRDNETLLKAVTPYIRSDWDVYTRNILLWRLYEWFTEEPKNDHENTVIDDVKEESAMYSMRKQGCGLNTIIYGPPGTGKTFHTIEASVIAAEPHFTFTNRNELKARYDELVAAKRIRFVTFHQSYGYEEFVEGLKANTEQGQISYDVESGVFKQICTDAEVKETGSLLKFDRALEELKLACEDDFISLKTSRGKSFKLTYHGNATFRVYPNESIHEDLGSGYPASIKHLKSFYLTGDESDIYNRSYVRAILNHLMSDYGVLEYQRDDGANESPNFVLVIDEINRGNISKIFGELITLIEPSKRIGCDEALSLQLPYSNKLFSVPSNLYIIGTMNTADRSLAMMDTALRRRFDFREMMPKPELFDGVEIKGIQLKKLLETMNQRIEVLYDREHTLGHAFLMLVKKWVDDGDQEAAFSELKSVFQNKIIPLLEEYFFEDWNKIRLVLGDNQKKETKEALQFIKSKTDSYDDIFGSDHGLDNYETAKTTYQLASFDGDDSVWNNQDAYIGIYDPQSGVQKD